MHSSDEIASGSHKIRGCNQFVENFIVNSAKRGIVKYIESKATLIKRIIFKDLAKRDLERYEWALANVEHIDLWNTTGNFEYCLRLCTNVKRLEISNVYLRQKWIYQNYPSTLEHVVLHECDAKIRKFCVLLEKNPNIRSLSVTVGFLLENEESFKTTNATLDKLSVTNQLNYYENLLTLLKDLHHRGFYKRLHFDINYKYIHSDLLGMVIDIVENLSFSTEVLKIFIWPTMFNLKEVSSTEIEIDYIGRLFTHAVNIEHIIVRHATADSILFVIRRLRKMKKIIVKYFGTRSISHKPEDILDIPVLNDAREKLPGASRVLIYLAEEDYLRAKWTYDNREFNFIDVRRHDNQHYN